MNIGPRDLEIAARGKHAFDTLLGREQTAIGDQKRIAGGRNFEHFGAGASFQDKNARDDRLDGCGGCCFWLVVVGMVVQNVVGWQILLLLIDRKQEMYLLFWQELKIMETPRGYPLVAG